MSPPSTPVVRYRDADILVVDKPSGLPTQATRGDRQRHLYGWLSARERYVGLHHRLDTPASGLLLLTCHRRANRAIARALADGSMKRTYLVVTVGDPGDQGCWDAPVDGKPARTHWRRLHSGGGMSLIEVRLETGRTHQIRRHALGAGHPVVGDRRYGGRAARAWPRLALHAWQLSLPHPRTGETLSVRAPVPDDLQALLVRTGWTREAPDATSDQGSVT